MLTTIRLLLIWATSKLYSVSSLCPQGQPQDPKQASPVLATLLDLLMVTKTVYIPVLAMRLPMPLLLQPVLILVQPLVMLWEGMAAGEGAGLASTGAYYAR